MPRASEAGTSSQKADRRKPYKRPDGQVHRDDRNNDQPKGKGKGRETGKGSDRPRRPPQHNNSTTGGATDVGISKIKSSLRQTKRLLAKDNLASDARQEAERRLISLEQDLEARQSSEHDRKNAERYHKIRFFERQKLVRQIKKLKKEISEGQAQNKSAAELQEKRVLLNYVLNFPTKYKYVALFPSHGESPLTKPAQVAVETEASRRAAKTYEQAQDVRQKVIRAMEKGELSSEPEVELDRRGDGTSKQKRPRIDLNDDDDGGDAGEARTTGDKKTSKKHKKSKSSSHKKSAASEKAPKSQGGIEGDDFFASDVE